MFFCILQKSVTFSEFPVLHTISFVVFRNSIQHFPMLQNNLICFKQCVSISINMVWFGSAAIVFQDRKIFTLFQFFNRTALDVVAAVIKMTGVMTKVIK